MAGLLAGLLGVGGGLIIVPVLAWLFVAQQLPSEIIMHLALGTSLASIVLTSVSSSYAHHRHAAVLWPVVVSLSPGIIIGALLGSFIADGLPSDLLRTIFALFEIAVAMQMGFSLIPQAGRNLPGSWGRSAAGGVIGVVSSIVGIGGGTLTVPFLVFCRVSIHKAVATSAACGLPIALAGSLGYVMMGWQNQSLPENSVGFVYLPALVTILLTSMLFAPLGARLAHRLPVATLKKIFAGLLFILGVIMLAT